ncbi:MAG TPA: ISNCY family transposase [Rhodomicrobium sp.]|nr:ISNCY family transposase [Rhodomicrobium sp.]
MPSLLAGLRAVCGAFPDPRKGRGGNIAMADFGLSAFAMFFMQSASFLSFQRTLEKGQGRSNCQTLFGIEKIPSDNYIRDMLDAAAPASLAPCFERLEQLLQKDAMREAFGRLGGRTLVALDGTEYFCSYKIACPHCQTRKRGNGKVESYHSMLAATVVAPGHAKVIPLQPEFIVKQDGAEKQDCERGAVKRWHEKHGARLKSLRPIYLADDLFACHSVCKMLMDADDDFIFTAKEASHKALYDFIDGAELERHQEKVKKGKSFETLRYRFIKDVPLREGKDAVRVNWIGFEILDAKGAVKYKTALVTSLDVTKSNVAEIVACGRARWKIENESFNVLKNHGYELEHNFGHGENYLAMTLAALNMLAFAWHTALDLLEPPWKQAREAAEKRSSFFAHIGTLTTFVVFPSWSGLLEALATFTLPPHLLAAQKIE